MQLVLFYCQAQKCCVAPCLRSTTEKQTNKTMKNRKEQPDMEKNFKFEHRGQTHLNLQGETLISPERNCNTRHQSPPKIRAGFPTKRKDLRTEK